MRKYHYVPHVRARGDEKRAIQQGYKAKRWIVEVAHSWLNRFRKLLVRFEKTNASYEALLHFAASIIAFRKNQCYLGICSKLCFKKCRT